MIFAGSIILNTMLGTVYERKSEIAVLNAIGLNPTHIFLFFLAEAFVYCLLGSVGGYLIGQSLAMGMKATGLISGVNINFSSLIVVYAILFTMGLVLLSTLYPGYVATRAAVPSGKRKWAMPDHTDGNMNIVFPFIYRPPLAPGTMIYLHDFISGLTDQSQGDIVAKLESVTESQGASGRFILALRYNVALAPYDLGVTQNVTFTTQLCGTEYPFVYRRTGSGETTSTSGAASAGLKSRMSTPGGWMRSGSEAKYSRPKSRG